MNVYVIESGSYEERDIEIIFATRELAEVYIAEGMRLGYEAELAQHNAFWAQFPPDVKPSLTGRMSRDFPTYADWAARHTVGDITEHEVHDALPVMS